MNGIIKKAGRALLPNDFGWVTVVGNPYSKIQRINPVLRIFGIQHMDIYFAFNERCPWKYRHARNENAQETIDGLLDRNGISDTQLTLVDLHTPRGTASAWQGEVRLFSEELIEDLLANDALVMLPFQTPNAMLAPEIEDIIGAMMLDGYTRQQADAEMIRIGEIKPSEARKPGWFYRPIGWYRNQFCEDEP